MKAQKKKRKTTRNIRTLSSLVLRRRLVLSVDGNEACAREGVNKNSADVDDGGGVDEVKDDGVLHAEPNLAELGVPEPGDADTGRRLQRKNNERSVGDGLRYVHTKDVGAL